MKIHEGLRQIGRVYFSKHPLARLLYLNAIAMVRQPYLEWKWRDLKGEATIENLETNTKYFASIYGLNQALYFETITNYAQDTNFRRQVGVNKEYLPLYHLAAIDFLTNNVPKDALILDICCGIGHFFIFLKKEGFYNFAGVDDSLFQPRIIKAAKAFLNHYQVSCRLYDFHISYPGNYHFLKESFNIVTYFGVGYHYLFNIVNDLLRPEGFFIYETFEKSWGGVWEEKFEFVKIYEGFGRVGQNTMVLRVKK